MSRIDDLLAELAPTGVEHMPVGDSRVSTSVVAGATPASGVTEYWRDGTIPWMSSGEVNKGTVYETDTLITQAAYDSCSTKLVPAGSVVIALAGQGKTRGMVARTRLELCTNQSLAAIVPGPLVDSDFLYHFLTTQYLRLREISSGDGTRGGLNLQMVRAFRIPVPPLEVQREIVRVLDTFAEMESSLQSALENETNDRRAQFAAARDDLVRGNRVERIPLSSLGSFTRGRRFTKEDYVAEGIPAIHYADIYTQLGTSTDHAVSHVRQSLAPALRFAASGDVILTGVGETVEDVGKAVAWLGKSGVAIHDDTFAFRHSLDPTYVAYALRTSEFIDAKSSLVARAKVKRISADSLGSLSIPVPPLDEQRRIADVLDTLDAEVTELTANLSAELAARRTQYEYYRDKLLTFREAPA